MVRPPTGGTNAARASAAGSSRSKAKQRGPYAVNAFFRWFPRAIASFASLACAFAMLAPLTLRAAPRAIWTQFRLNPQNNAVIAGDLSTSWSFETGFAISASPAIDGTRLFVGNNNGRFVALDVRDGRLVWSRQMASSMKSQPLLWDDLVIAGEGNEIGFVHHGVVHLGAGENALVAFDRATGQIRWRTFLQGSGMSAPAIVDGLLVHADSDGDAVGIDPASGHVRYARKIGTIASMSVARPLSGGAFAIGGQTATQLAAIRAADGAVLWRYAFPRASGLGDCAPASDGVRIYCDYLLPIAPHPYVKAGERNEQHAFALQASSGALAWDVHLEDGIVPMRNQTAIPLVDRGLVFMGSPFAPYIHALDVRTGALRWRARVRGAVKGGIVAVGGTLYFGDLRGYLWALDERDGRVVGVKFEGTPFNVGSPVVVGGTLIVGSGTGRILAVPLAAIRAGHDAPRTRPSA